MLVRIIVCALVAGVLAGIVSALLQQALVVPVLLEAERYESGEIVHFGGHSEAGHDHDDDAHDHTEAKDNRHLITAVMTVAINLGYALLLIAAFYARSARPDLRQGMVWGLCGFIAFVAAPAAGLAPELPGTAAAALEARQFWWLITVVLAVFGLWLIAFVRQVWAIPVAAAAIAVPHIIGAPHPAAPIGPAPPELAAEFAARALAVGLASWAVLGAAAAWAWNWQGAEEI